MLTWFDFPPDSGLLWLGVCHVNSTIFPQHVRCSALSSKQHRNDCAGWLQLSGNLGLLHISTNRYYLVNDDGRVAQMRFLEENLFLLLSFLQSKASPHASSVCGPFRIVQVRIHDLPNSLPSAPFNMCCLFSGRLLLQRRRHGCRDQNLALLHCLQPCALPRRLQHRHQYTQRLRMSFVSPIERIFCDTAFALFIVDMMLI